MCNINYCVTDYGVVNSATTLQTKQFQHVIDKCFLEGGGRVVVPDGTYLIGGIRLRSNVTLYLQKGAVLLGSRNPEDYFAYLEDEIEPLDSKHLTEFARCGHQEFSQFVREQGREENYYLGY